MKVALTLALALLAYFGASAPRNGPPAKTQDDASQRATCAEVPYSVTEAWAKKFSERTNCSLSVAIFRAKKKAYDDAFAAVEPKCREQISASEAEAVCRGLGNFVVAETTSAIVDVVPRPQGADNIDDKRSIDGASLCVTFRDYAPAVTGCTAKVKVLARCGVKCMSLE